MIQCKLRSEAIIKAQSLVDVLNKDAHGKYYHTQICDYESEVRIYNEYNEIECVLEYTINDNNCLYCKFHMMSDFYLECQIHNRINNPQKCDEFAPIERNKNGRL